MKKSELAKALTEHKDLTLKQAEDGDALILRLIETAGRETTATVALPTLSLQRAWETNLVEENERPLSCTPHAVQTTLAPYAIRTLRIQAIPA